MVDIPLTCIYCMLFLFGDSLRIGIRWDEHHHPNPPKFGEIFLVHFFQSHLTLEVFESLNISGVWVFRRSFHTSSPGMTGGFWMSTWWLMVVSN